MVVVVVALTIAPALFPSAARAQPESAYSAATPRIIALEVDATDIDHRLLRVREFLPVQPGPLTLQFPHWIPGTHSPAGNVARLAGLRMRLAGAAGGAPVEWQRDPASVESFRVTIPAGASALNIAFEYLSSTRDTEDDQVIHDLLAVNWRNLLLYPAGSAAADILIEPAVILPSGWDLASALRETPVSAAGHSAGHAAGNAPGGPAQRRGYPPTSLEMLVDSPLYSAPRLRHLVLDADSEHPVMLHLLANEAAQIAPTEEQLEPYVRLVRQARTLFGARHYDHYDFILVIDDLFGLRGGLEHHQSSENGVKRGYFLDGDRALAMRTLLPHEFTHSWNGKFRRPRDLWTADYSAPMQDSLLWVYEGLTNYWGQVLAARSGLVSSETARANIAWQAAGARQRTGRAWRNLQDTTNEPVIARSAGRKDWIDWQRGADYYDEGSLLWLAVDVKLRQLTRDRRSLDDFARAFFGVDDGRVAPELYGFDDVVQALDGIAHFDWAAFLRTRLDTHESAGVLDGVEGSGWRLSFGDRPGDYARSLDDLADATSLIDSIGLAVGKDGAVTRVSWGGPAFAAGLAPGNTLVAVNARSYRADLLKQAVAAAKTAPEAIVLLVKDADVYRNVAVDYHEGLRYPRLERAEGSKDLLGEILAPR
jgi:predicted metalloprotease with PDZ domain